LSGVPNPEQRDTDGDLLPTPQTRVVFDGFDPTSKVWDDPWPDTAGSLTPASLPSTMHLVEVSLVDQTPREWHVDIGLILQPAASPMTFGVVLHDPSQPSSNDAFCGVNTQFQGIAPYVGDAGVSLATGAELPAGRLVTLRASLTTENGVLALSCSYGGAVFPLQLVAPLANVQIAITAEITDTITYLDVVE
jgi:hypothetical protein